MHTWDPERYLTYADERGRPFVELLARIGATDPAVVVDLGCGPGNLTALLARRWPDADISGIDASPEMIEAARSRQARPPGSVRFEVGDLRSWAAPDAVDVLVSNATLQWGTRSSRPAAAPGGATAAWWLVRLPGARQPR